MGKLPQNPPQFVIAGTATNACAHQIAWAFLLSTRIQMFARRRRIIGNLAALGATVNTVGRIAAGFLNDTVPAPLYRMPLRAFQYALPALVSENVFEHSELLVLNDFLENAEAFNRGLDQIHSYLEFGRAELAESEVQRLAVKANKLRPTGGSLYDLTARILARKPGGFTPRQPDSISSESFETRLMNLRARFGVAEPTVEAA